MITAVCCTCGSVDKTIRRRLERHGYADFLTMRIYRGKDKSLLHVGTLPQFEATELLRTHIKKSSKFAIIVGYDETDLRWVDLVNGKKAMNDIEAELLIKRFA